MASTESSQQLLLAEEYFSAEDNRFVATLREAHDAKRIAAFADRWKRDGRPWAREQKIAYLRREPNCVGHQPIVKRLFKQAEEDGDDEVMAACAALFDRLVRHEVKTRYRYDWQSRSTWQEEYLAATGPELPRSGVAREGINPFTGEKVTFPPPRPPRGAIYFSYRTRYYLQRRAWRYYRKLARGGADRYLSAAILLLLEYQDSDFDRGERILDCWTLLQLAFRGHPALEFGRERIRLAEGAQLGQLKAAPRYLEHWQQPGAFPQLIMLMREAPSRLVRVWAMQLVEQEHQPQVAQLSADQLLSLLASEDEDIQQFAGRQLKHNDQLASLPLETWLNLLDSAAESSLPAICDAMRTHIAAEQLSLSECVELALAQPSPVAELGFQWLRSRTIATEADYEQISRLSEAKCFALAGEMAAWALGLVGSAAEYDRDHVSRFFDSLNAAVRDSAWNWLEQNDCPGAQDPVLFCRLLETPFEDLRLRVVERLEHHKVPGEAKTGLLPVWTAVLLGVHRGGRQKLKATRQLAAALVADPSLADSLLPVLAAAVRSIRKPEARAGLAAIATSLAVRPELADLVAQHLPELQVVAEGVPE